MRRDSSSVKAYIATVEGEQRTMIDTLRSLIKDSAPGSVEGIKYGMLGYDVGNEVVCLAAQKHYVSLYVNPKLVDPLREDLEGVDIGKSCLRFKRPEQIPVPVIRRLLKSVEKAGH